MADFVYPELPVNPDAFVIPMLLSSRRRRDLRSWCQPLRCFVPQHDKNDASIAPTLYQPDAFVIPTLYHPDAFVIPTQEGSAIQVPTAQMLRSSA